MDHPPVVVRIWVDAEKVVEERMSWEQAIAPDAVGRHTDTAAGASKEGKKFLMEFEFEGFPEHERYLRWGTDPDGMVIPIPVRVEDL